MIAEENTQAQSNMPRQTMSIANNSVVFDLLINRLYSNKPLAIIREYLCNAYDAQVDAGTPDTPISVHLPTRLEPWFSVRDYGTGMSAQTINDVFSTLGESTKRGSNEQTGMLGIGSKSALTANDSFMVTSYYNGAKSIYSVFLDNGMPTISHFSSTETSEPNGLDVNVPIPSSWTNTMHSEAEKFLKHFKGNTDINVGLDTDLGEILFQGSNWKIYDKGAVATIVMGNIPYPLDLSLLPNNSGVLKATGLVIEVPIGSIQFAASRETLSYTESTIKAILEISQRVHAELVNEANKIATLMSNNLIGLSRALSALPFVIRQAIFNDQINKYFNYSYSVCGKEVFRFKVFSRGSDILRNLSVIGEPEYNNIFIMADSSIKARDLALHYKSTQNRVTIVLLNKPYSYYGGKAEGLKDLKGFCDILGVPYVVASEEYSKLIGKQVTTRRGNKSILPYKATGFTVAGSSFSNEAVNHYTVSEANKSFTIGIPITANQIMSADYKTEGPSILKDNIRLLLRQVPIQNQLTFVYIPKSYKDCLANTTDVYTWLKTLKLPRVSLYGVDVSKEHYRSPFNNRNLLSCNLSKEFRRYIDEVIKIGEEQDVTSYVEAAKELGVPLIVKKIAITPLFEATNTKYNMLKVAARGVGYSIDDKWRFEALAKLIEKETK